MASTIDGQPWGEYRPWPDGPSHDEINNAALIPASIEHGYCLCLHPFMNVINFAGLGCTYCAQVVTDDSFSEAAKTLRAEAIKAAFPELAAGR
jgi:hypothetical protein